MNKKFIFAFAILMMFFLGISLVSCATFPKADVTKICRNYEQCITNSGGAITEEQHNECVKMTETNGELQDVAFLHCAGLRPCQFSVCMKLHFDARRTAYNMLKD